MINKYIRTYIRIYKHMYINTYMAELIIDFKIIRCILGIHFAKIMNHNLKNLINKRKYGLIHNSITESKETSQVYERDFKASFQLLAKI